MSMQRFHGSSLSGGEPFRIAGDVSLSEGAPRGAYPY